ncbi:Nucleotidylyl transferase [Guyanagaster necrorhizus]|uniref:Nucleotidylyl transferase n=1 Tax=Guyanagaster necrorhizus TaxID=856835 RepID=A0A9P7W3H3_9AGAR|nr:Nucleotidylyl transferase [Guyanagaster necrorhizus MCA 3950]KAG7451290.1 Nucleotidylyl transferase [Guyanagaster necrorhizus MCA 3950]
MTLLPKLRHGAKVLILDSSFNPPTLAHLALARCGNDYDARILMLSTTNADKKIAPGDASLAQRQSMMGRLGFHIAVIDEATFVGKARRLHAEMPSGTWDFVMGWDTVERVFAERYYTGKDMIAELKGFFFESRARIVYAPRAGAGGIDVWRAVEGVGAREKMVQAAILDEFVAYSSTGVRNAIKSGDVTWRDKVPAVIAEYIDKEVLFGGIEIPLQCLRVIHVTNDYPEGPSKHYAPASDFYALLPPQRKDALTKATRDLMALEPPPSPSNHSLNQPPQPPPPKRFRPTPPPLVAAKSTLLSPSQKKANHIQSEQKRRANIRRGYEALCQTVPALREAIRQEQATMSNDSRGEVKRRRRGRQGGSGGEVSADGRAGPRSENVVLCKTIEYIHALAAEREALLARLHYANSRLPTPLPPPPNALWERTWTDGDSRDDDESDEYAYGPLSSSPC